MSRAALLAALVGTAMQIAPALADGLDGTYTVTSQLEKARNSNGCINRSTTKDLVVKGGEFRLVWKTSEEHVVKGTVAADGTMKGGAEGAKPITFEGRIEGGKLTARSWDRSCEFSWTGTRSGA